MSYIILDLAHKANPDVTDREVRKIVDVDKSRAYVVDYDQDTNPLEDDWITSHLTTIEVSFNGWDDLTWVEVHGVTVPEGYGNDYINQGGATVVDGLRAMYHYDQEKSAEELQDVFARWTDRGIEIAALHASDLSRPYVTPDHALPRDALLLVGDGAQSAAEIVNRVAQGYVWEVGICTLSELRALMIESMELDEDETIWDMLEQIPHRPEQIYGSDQTGIRPWECGDHLGGVIGEDDYLTTADVRHLF